MIKSTLIPIVVAPLILSASGLAAAAFPSQAPTQVTTLTFSGNGQSTAVDTDDDTVYVVSTSPENLTAYASDLVTAQTLGLAAAPNRVAVDSDDDSVYVLYSSPASLGAFRANLSSVRSVTLTGVPKEIAVHPTDDTVYITSAIINRLLILKGSNLDDSILVAVGANPRAVAVNPVDDTIYVGNENDRTISILSPSGVVVDTVSVAPMIPSSIVVHPTNGTVYIAGAVETRLLVASPDLSQRSWVGYNNGPYAQVASLAVTPDGSTLYAAMSGYNDQSIAFNTAQMDDSYVFVVGSNIVSVAATDSASFFARNFPGVVAVMSAPPVVSSVSPSSGPYEGGTAITISGSGFVPGVTTVTIGGAPLQGVTVTPTQITGVTPGGDPGTVLVSVTRWSQTVTAGFRYIPPPPVPASVPRGVIAVSGDGRAEVSWQIPASQGSFPISTYQAVSSPGGHTCLVAAPALSCEVQGLANGTTYTFTVRALNGAGWSAASDPSNAVTPEAAPQPTVVIAGTREGKRIVVSGTSSGFGIGGTLRPWVRTAGQTSFAQGSATILVSMDGTFEWGRRTGKRVSVYVATPDGSVRSNTVRIGPH